MSSPPKKQAKLNEPNNFAICIKCQQPGGDLVKSPQSYQKFLDSVHERAKYGEPLFLQMNSRLLNLTADDLAEYSATWHRPCFQQTVHNTMIQRARNRYEKSLSNKDAFAILNYPEQGGRPKSEPVEAPKIESSDRSKTHTSTKFTRSSSSHFAKDLCFFCSTDRPNEDLHEVRSLDVGRKICEAVEHSDNEQWKVHLQPLNPNDARAIDIKYHLRCYNKYVIRQKQTSSPDDSCATDAESCVAAEIEFFCLLKSVLETGRIIPIDELCSTYNGILRLHGAYDNMTNKTMKVLILKHFPNVEISRPQRKQCEQVCSTATKDAAIGHEAESQRDSRTELQAVFKAARCIRQQIQESRANQPWTFDGSLLGDDRVPTMLRALLWWILNGRQEDLKTEKRSQLMYQACTNISQTIMYEFKSNKQVSLKPTNVESGFRHRLCDENEHVLGVGLKVHTYTRSKHLVEFLHQNNVSVGYQRILRVETQLAEAVLKRIASTGGVYVPPGFQKHVHIFFAADNIDFLEDTPDGKQTFHGTVITVFQQQGSNPLVHEKLDIGPPTTNRSLRSIPQSITELSTCNIKGSPKPETSPKYNDFKPFEKSCPHVEDTTWFLAGYQHRSQGSTDTTVVGQTESEQLPTTSQVNETGDASSAPSLRSTEPTETGDASTAPSPITGSRLRSTEPTETGDMSTAPAHTPDKSNCFLTWSGYNSLTTDDRRPLTNVFVLPLIAAPANQWQTLLTVLMQAQHITAEVVGPGRKTIITLDMDLYMRAIKVEALHPEHKGKWIIRPGEFHAVLCTLRSIGSAVENSGIDDSWVEAELFSPTTTRQILEGKHMKRALDAHTMTLQVLFDLLLAEFTDKQAALSHNISDVLKVLLGTNLDDDEDVRHAHREVVTALENSNFTEKFEEFCLAQEQEKPMFKFARIYIGMVCNLLQFIRASREGLWLLHLTSLEKLCTYFFSQNRLKYAQNVPEYIARMYSLQTTDPEIWEEFSKGNFCVKKSTTAFCSIGVDHALEQENRKMKVLCGFTGITRQQSTLARSIFSRDTQRSIKCNKV